MTEISAETVEKSRELLEHACQAEASDIHFIPRMEDTLVELRIHGYLYQMTLLPAADAERIINHFKYLSGMDIGERRLPQSGSMRLIINSEVVSLRLSTLPTPEQESLVIRLLPQQKELAVRDLSVFQEATEGLASLLNFNSGMILISGPTGSGKTTTLYTMLMELQKRYHARIITIEDPIEIRNHSFVQMEVNEKAHFSYAEGFKAILRHDPDIIMIGEIRDENTAKMAVRASLTGHLVLSTVHAFNASGTIRRMTELGVPQYDLKETLVGVIAQRLVNIQCPECGPVCRTDCSNRHHPSRTGIFEILTGMALHEYLSSRSRSSRPAYKTFDDYLEEGVTNGLIEKREWKGGGIANAESRTLEKERTGKDADSAW
ncbi:competence type IV pilus ATPase ComGA [Sporolactobacillus sp. THM19-2]|uniref:competence type IV pilus ATPase ComGA n=1 Tax=Sporolactobacillus sp. THM19-2 TaxID=2511171 RepID=UPI001F0FB9E1|nr:competence type IV pilus ATPase ComGA [Sporolactobacillus sp. THM19-2]